MSPYNVASSNAPEFGSLAFAPFFLNYPKRPANMPKTRAFQRALDTILTSRKPIAVLPKVGSERASDWFIAADKTAAFDRVAPYKKPVRCVSSVSLEGDGYLRLEDVLTVYPVSRSAWYAGIQQGIYPPPIPLGRRSVGWSRAAIRALVETPPKF